MASSEDVKGSMYMSMLGDADSNTRTEIHDRHVRFGSDPVYRMTNAALMSDEIQVEMFPHKAKLESWSVTVWVPTPFVYFFVHFSNLALNFHFQLSF